MLADEVVEEHVPAPYWMGLKLESCRRKLFGISHGAFRISGILISFFRQK